MSTKAKKTTSTKNSASERVLEILAFTLIHDIDAEISTHAGKLTVRVGDETKTWLLSDGEAA